MEVGGGALWAPQVWGEQDPDEKNHGKKIPKMQEIRNVLQVETVMKVRRRKRSDRRSDWLGVRADLSAVATW